MATNNVGGVTNKIAIPKQEKLWQKIADILKYVKVSVA